MQDFQSQNRTQYRGAHVYFTEGITIIIIIIYLIAKINNNIHNNNSNNNQLPIQC